MILPWEENYNQFDISSAIEIPMNYEHGSIGFGQETAGYFRKELIDSGIVNTFDAIKAGLRTATTRSVKYKKGQLILFTKKDSKEKLLCQCVCNSYKVSNIDTEEWSLLEGWDVSYFNLNPGIRDKYQFKFKYIKII